MKKHIFGVLVLIVCLQNYLYAQFPNTDPIGWGSPLFNEEFNYSSWNNFEFKNNLDPLNNPNSHPNDPSWGLNLWGEGGEPFYRTFDAVYTSLESDNGSNFEFHPLPNSDPCNCSYMTFVTKDHRASPLTKTITNWSHGTYTKSFPYSTGILYTDNDKGWKYGYFEISIRLPEYKKVYRQIYTPYYNPNPPTVFVGTDIEGCSMSAWLFGADGSHGIGHSELDMIESFNGYNLHTSNVHFKDNQNPHVIDYGVESAWGVNSPGSLGSNRSVFYDGKFHTIGMEWTSKYVRFYIDHNLVREVLPYAADFIPMGWILEGDVNGYDYISKVSLGTKFPYKFDINYVKVWKLDMTQSANNLSIDGITALRAYDHKVRQDITISGSSSTEMLSSDHVTVRAINGITIPKNFTVPVGATFSAVTTGGY